MIQKGKGNGMERSMVLKNRVIVLVAMTVMWWCSSAL